MTIKEQLKELKADSVSGGMVKDYSGSIDMLVDLSNEINVDVDKLVELRRFWKVRFDLLPSGQKNVMERYYFENMTWESIAVNLNYSWRHVHRFHSRALYSLEKMS